MRIGLTQLDPNTGFELPLYALPDLVSMGPCWLYAITKRHNLLEHRYDRFTLDQPPLPLHDGLPLPLEDGRREEEEESEEALGIAGAVFENNPAIAIVADPPLFPPDLFDSIHPLLLDGDGGGGVEENLEENALNTDHQRRANREQVLRRKKTIILLSSLHKRKVGAVSFGNFCSLIISFR